MCVRLAGEVGRVSGMEIESEVGITRGEPHIYLSTRGGGRFVVGRTRTPAPRSGLVARLVVTGLFTFSKAFPRDSGRPLPLFPWPGEMEKT